MYAVDAVSGAAHMKRKVAASRRMFDHLKAPLEEMVAHEALVDVAELIAAATQVAKLDGTDRQEWHDSEPPPCLV